MSRLERCCDFTPLVYPLMEWPVKRPRWRRGGWLHNKVGSGKGTIERWAGYVRTRMCLAVLCANTFLIRDSLERRSWARPLMDDDGAAMVGWRHWRAHW
jgi:hypothetical protein